ncbi:hypothetical protein [Archangium sp.]|uniref:hypothetical protein n=1 Tax=Archangium sp. TaxID=1872627 RepID=UPI002D3DFD1F|nr:hypothetical protein [Archangium sp.]HYO60013.1 hypothetical protein [Archangium sp.]
MRSFFGSHWPLARIGRAQAAEVLERTEEAVADYTVALELEPAQPLVLANRASLLYAAGRGEAALADLEAALVLAPKLAELHRNRAPVLAEQGRASEEAEELRTYLQLARRADFLWVFERWQPAWWRSGNPPRRAAAMG